MVIVCRTIIVRFWIVYYFTVVFPSYQGDVEAWTELCDLYLRECDYSKAAFCMEELIVFNSNNHVYYTKYADVSEYTCSVHHSRNTRYHQILSWMNRISADHLWCIDNFTAPTGIYKFNVPYAQIKYTEGKSIETARKYYAHALRLNKSSMRALFGFYLVGGISIQNCV